jgi:hypothetical protein
MDKRLLLVLAIVALPVLLCVYNLVFGVWAGCENPIQIWRGVLSDHDFDLLTTAILQAQDLQISPYRATSAGGRYSVWIANGYFAFAINGLGGHSFRQKRRFFRALNAIKLKRPETVLLPYCQDPTINDLLSSLKQKGTA